MSAHATSPNILFGHSTDYYIRLRLSELLGVRFEHQHTEADPAAMEDAAGLAAQHAGQTEWSALGRDGHALSLGWDWALIETGVCLLSAVPPRTNIQLLDDRGYDLSPSESWRRLHALIESISWQNSVLHAIRPGWTCLDAGYLADATSRLRPNLRDSTH